MLGFPITMEKAARLQRGGPASSSSSQSLRPSRQTLAAQTVFWARLSPHLSSLLSPGRFQLISSILTQRPPGGSDRGVLRGESEGGTEQGDVLCGLQP